MPDERFSKRYRLRTPGEFKRVFERKRGVTNGRMTVAGRENDLGVTRLGLSVSRRVGNATVRNRWKRLLREAFRLSREKLPVGLDLVVVAKSDQPPTLVWLLDELPRMVGELERKLRK
jgi:ribonuclease P protein component